MRVCEHNIITDFNHTFNHVFDYIKTLANNKKVINNDENYLVGYQDQTDYFEPHTHRLGLDYNAIYYLTEGSGTEIYTGDDYRTDSVYDSTAWQELPAKPGELYILSTRTFHRFFMKSTDTRRIVVSFNFSIV
jgi:hypothetical protein